MPPSGKGFGRPDSCWDLQTVFAGDLDVENAVEDGVIKGDVGDSRSGRTRLICSAKVSHCFVPKNRQP